MRVVVMGGSVAGLSSAKFLSSRNVEVELYERKKEIGKGIVCGGGISSFMLKRLGIDLPDQFVLNTVRKVHFYAPNESVSEIEMNRECGYILDREGWEEWMGQSLIDDGIKVHTNYRSPLEAIRRGDVVVGADGLSGITRTIANRGLPPANDVYIGIQTVARTRKIGDDAISMFFGSRWSTKAYAWAFPIGGSIFRVGTAAPLGDKELTSKLNNLIKFLDATPHSKPKAKMIPLAKPRKSLICGKIAYVGDAGLQTDPLTGGGIATAVIGARALSDALAEGQLSKYDQLWKESLLRQHKIRYWLKTIFTELSDGELNELISLLNDIKLIREDVNVGILQNMVNFAFKKPRIIVRHKMFRRLFGHMIK